MSGDKIGDNNTNPHSDNSSEVDTNIVNDKDELDSNKEATEPTNDRSNIPTENVENMQVIDATSKVEVVDVLCKDVLVTYKVLPKRVTLCINKRVVAYFVCCMLVYII